jgi:Mrp family chromosome partitioning ATPase/DUF971 family protein
MRTRSRTTVLLAAGLVGLLTSRLVEAWTLQSTMVPLRKQVHSNTQRRHESSFMASQRAYSLRLESSEDPSSTAEPSSPSPLSSDSTSSIPTDWQTIVLNQLRQVIDPDLNNDIVSLGFVKNLRVDESTQTVSFIVELTTPACPVKDQFAQECKDLVESLDWVKAAEVTMTASSPVSTNAEVGLSQVGAIIAVSSCKGGVGKSTTAVNLAFTLSQLGATVGIFDADVYGPSLPTMVTPHDDVVRFVGRQIAPLQRDNVRLMSFGYINEESAIMRGPMVTQLLDQLLNVVHWGSLDYLVLDMPPGTGDIPLTLTQRLNITAAVIVTTPQELSFVDVVRGVQMFDSVNVPCVAVVENMAYYTAPSSSQSIDTDKLKSAIYEKLQSTSLSKDLTGADTDNINSLAQELVDLVTNQLSTNTDSATSDNRVQLFGPGHSQRLTEQWGMDYTFAIPLMDRISASGDSGTPYVVQNPTSAAAQVYKDLAQVVVSEVSKIKYQNKDNVALVYNEESGMLELGEDRLTPVDLRRACKCASCVEELTGKQLLMPFMVPETVKPRNLSPTGNYAVSIDWTDGHRSLYPYRQIRSMLQSQKEKKELQQSAGASSSDAKDAAAARASAAAEVNETVAVL